MVGAMAPLGVLSIEGEWDKDRPADRQSVRPLLSVLEAQGDIESFHRDAATRAELYHLLDRWTSEARYRNFRFLYLSFHGAPGLVALSDGDVTLGRLATRLEGKCHGRVIHFGSCESLNVSTRRLASFRETTGAALVSGYRGAVDWVESASLDMMLVSYLARGRADRTDLAVAKLRRRNPVLADKLGLVTDFGGR